MASHPTLEPHDAADRLAIRELLDAYAHCADTRDAQGTGRVGVMGASIWTNRP
jgi:hypothetical protein